MPNKQGTDGPADDLLLAKSATLFSISWRHPPGGPAVAATMGHAAT